MDSYLAGESLSSPFVPGSRSMEGQEVSRLPFFVHSRADKETRHALRLLSFREGPANLFYLGRAVLAWCQNPHNTKDLEITGSLRILSIFLSGISGTNLGLLEGIYRLKRSYLTRGCS